MWVQLATMKPQWSHNKEIYPRLKKLSSGWFLHEYKTLRTSKDDIALDKLSVKEYEDLFRESGK